MQEPTSTTTRKRFDVPNAHELMPRSFKDYIVSEKELGSLGFLSAFGGVSVALFGVALGAAIALKITLDTVPIPEVQTQAKYFAAYLVSVGFTIVCGLGAAISLLFTFFDVRRIKKNSEQEKRRREFAETEEASITRIASGFESAPKSPL